MLPDIPANCNRFAGIFCRFGQYLLFSFRTHQRTHQNRSILFHFASHCGKGKRSKIVPEYDDSLILYRFRCENFRLLSTIFRKMPECVCLAGKERIAHIKIFLNNLIDFSNANDKMALINRKNKPNANAAQEWDLVGGLLVLRKLRDIRW